MIELGVNIDHVATLRQVRGTTYPSPVEAALIAESAGADAITLHLREDRRHIQDSDVKTLRNLLKTRMNLESAVTDEMITFALSIKPDDVCLVPERREELTTEGGLDVLRHFAQVRRACNKLAGRYSDALTAKGQQEELEKICSAVTHGVNQGLKVNAGHGLHYNNVQSIAAITDISELNIGHSIVARALFIGFEQAVQEMKKLMLEEHK